MTVAEKWPRLDRKVNMKLLFGGNLCNDPQTWNKSSQRCQWRDLQTQTPNDTKRQWRKGCWIRSTHVMRKMTMKQYSPVHIFGKTKTPACLFLSEEWKEKRFWVGFRLDLWNASAAQWNVQNPTAESLLCREGPHLIPPRSYVTQDQQSLRRESEPVSLRFFMCYGNDIVTSQHRVYKWYMNETFTTSAQNIVMDC